MNTSEITSISESEEICNECGRSVTLGSGWFVNRVPDSNPFDERIEMEKPFPHGAFICADCEAELNSLTEHYSSLPSRTIS